jgi:hypothetical protein
LNVGALLALVAVAGRVRPSAAVLLGVGGAASIWLRGYFVPFTPRFAPPLFALLPGNYFEHAPPALSDTLDDLDSAGDGTAAEADGEAVLGALVDAGVVGADGDHIELAEDFAAVWRAEMDALAAASDRRLADAACESTSAGSARIERAGWEAPGDSAAAVDSETFLVVSGEGGSTSWIHRPVALAEVAAARALRDTDFSPERRGLAAHALCSFLDACPACEEAIVETSLADCCGHAVPDLDTDLPTVLACEACGVVFYRFE